MFVRKIFGAKQNRILELMLQTLVWYCRSVSGNNEFLQRYPSTL